MKRYDAGPGVIHASAAGEFVKYAHVAELAADGERLRYMIAILHAAEAGDPTAARVMNDVPPPETEGDRDAVMQAYRVNIDAMRAKWQPLEWD